MTFTIRQPSPLDASKIADLHVSTWREAYSHLLPEEFFGVEHIRMRHAMWNEILENPRDEWTVRVAESAGELGGFATVGPSARGEGHQPAREWQLYNLYVAKRLYGSGVGQSLLEQTLGDGPALLWVAKQNPRAIAFYRSNGFEFDGVEQIDPAAPKIIDARMLR